jgi:hypothetical protein
MLVRLATGEAYRDLRASAFPGAGTAAMDAQVVVNEGRHQGGRAPYGDEVVDAGPHPNPCKAAGVPTARARDRAVRYPRDSCWRP